MLDQEDDPELNYEWLTSDEQLTRFSKAREKIMGRVKVIEFLYVQGTQSSEEDLVVRERVPDSTEIPAVREPGTNGKHSPIGQAQNGGSSANSQEIPVSMEYVCPEGNKNQYVTSPSGESLGRNVNVRRSKRIRNSPQRYNPGFGADQEDDPELDNEWLTVDEQLTRFRKAREKIVGRVKGTESPSVQGTQSSEEYLVIRERVLGSTEIPAVREPGTNGNHEPIGQAQNSGSSANSR